VVVVGIFKGTQIKICKRTDTAVAFIRKYFKYRIHRKTCETNYNLKLKKSGV
jgi:hypothetical protein